MLLFVPAVAAAQQGVVVVSCASLCACFACSNARAVAVVGMHGGGLLSPSLVQEFCWRSQHTARAAVQCSKLLYCQHHIVLSTFVQLYYSLSHRCGGGCRSHHAKTGGKGMGAWM